MSGPESIGAICIAKGYRLQPAAQVATTPYEPLVQALGRSPCAARTPPANGEPSPRRCYPASKERRPPGLQATRITATVLPRSSPEKRNAEEGWPVRPSQNRRTQQAEAGGLDGGHRLASASGQPRS
ncbi:hypothetical protein GCM10010260_30110 [Streptomyces filipinensis]|uniref:Uncharacterized protein n=1 Tax=Streptomyces filipinensis TaxID=66887 RepID=A0A918MBA0_9ACTN|nr:hypothetical protein GCM10010260_30110 [Streptomyces filipinensis]